MEQPRTKEKFNRKQENNAIVNNAVGEILLNENTKIKCCKGSTRIFGL